MRHYIHLKEIPFDKISNGIKTIELRLYDEKRRKIQVGDTICFNKSSEPHKIIVAEVIALHLFDCFADLYKNLPLNKCGYEPNEIETANPSDMNQYYSVEEQSEYGVVGIEFKISTSN